MHGSHTLSAGSTARQVAVAATAWLVLTAQATTPSVGPPGVRHEIPEPGFAVTVPPSYERTPAATDGSELAVARFVENRRPAEEAISITIERLGGLLDRGDPRPPADDSDAKLHRLTWQSETVTVLVERGFEHGDAVRLTAPVPLAPEAVAIVVEGPSARYPELHAVLERVLAGLEGTVAWLDEDRDPAPPAGTGLMTVLVAIVVTVIVIALAPDLRRIRARRRRRPRRSE